MLRILHLEDSADDAFFIKQALNRHGVNADFAVVKNRAEFVAALEEQPCDLILADNGLPGFCGIEALQMARQKFPEVGFICVSGAAADEQVMASLNAGATDYLLKDQTWQLAVSVRREVERLQLLHLGRELERHLKERTIELQTANLELAAANRELQSFSHAVSHDLGAPLRRIRTFVQMLEEECGTALQENGRDYLARVQSGVGQMQALMDDLLRLTKVGRAELNIEPVNLSLLAQDIIARLAAQSPERKVDVRIAEGMEARGDRGLLRIVLQNLFSNAWKYTGKCEHAQIGFSGVLQPDGSTAYCVRDNGAGFAMENAGRLFQPFQRLHTQDEYPGSGIGLTTVQRIIHRHAGKVWAEAKVNEGAAFYFTLGSR